MLTYSFLQEYSWFLVSLVCALATFMYFVQGAGALLFTLGADDRQRSLIFEAVDVKWRFTFTGLILFIIVAFISFPGFQSDERGNGIGVWVPFLSFMVCHAVACEVLRRHTDVRWIRTLCRWVIFVCGWVIPFLVGFSGSFLSTGVGSTRWLNFAIGFFYIVVSQVSALLYLYRVIGDVELSERIRHFLAFYALLFAILLVMSIWFIVTADGVEYDADGNFTVVQLKYLSNFIEMPAALFIFLSGICLIATAIVIAIVNSVQRAFHFYTVGMLLIITGLFFVVGFNNTACFPNFSNPQLSLSIANSSASYHTLLIISVSSLAIPFIVALFHKAWSHSVNTRPSGL